MSSESESRLSNEELKQRNLPTEPLPPVTCPTSEQWTELVGILASLYQVMARQHNLILEQNKELENMSSTLYTLTKQMEKPMGDLSTIRWEVEQAGSRKERKHLCMPRLSLPRPTLAWLWAVPILAALAVTCYALVIGWNSLVKPLLTLLQ